MNQGDEISFLTQEFDRLLDSLEYSQRKLVEAEKNQSKMELARVVAHNIRSPAIAIEMMIPGLVAVPERMKKILKNAASEIRLLSEKLRTQSSLTSENIDSVLDTDLVYLPIFIDDLVRQKNLEYSLNNKIQVVNKLQSNCSSLYVKVSSLELKSILSNIINNSSEAYGTAGGTIEVSISQNSDLCEISIKDFGVGIPETVVSELGKKTVTTKGSSGRGIGLLHAFKTVERWSGSISINSTVGIGTEIKISLPIYSITSAKKEISVSKEIVL